MVRSRRSDGSLLMFARFSLGNRMVLACSHGVRMVFPYGVRMAIVWLSYGSGVLFGRGGSPLRIPTADPSSLPKDNIWQTE
eukprot:6330988-Pyramimonas_sp.AAC.1